MIVLCRHGATRENAEGRFLSRTDVPLSDEGRAQCVRLRERLRGIAPAGCLISPMRRCLETLEIAAGSMPFEVRDELREVNFGSWEGKTLEWLETHEPERLAQRRRDPVAFRPPQGESFADVAVRLNALIESLDEDGPVLIVSHRGTLAVLERLLRGIPLDSKIPGLEPGELRIVVR